MYRKKKKNDSFDDFDSSCLISILSSREIEGKKKKKKYKAILMYVRKAMEEK